ncbi:MAG: hypothetical protein JXJ04_13405 [Spirochaetales bacterium]|nr:hypothetical protein [Spirochaetales bacterium]
MKTLKKISVIFLLLVVAMVFGCTISDNGNLLTDEPIGDNIIEAKKDARAVMDTAHKEFFSGVGTVPAKSEPGEQGWSVKDTVIGLAWNALYTGDTTELAAYLKKSGLYEKYEKIVKQYDLEECRKILNTPSGVTAPDSRNQPASFFTSSSRYDGDIFLCTGGNSSAIILGVFIPGHWSHAGMMDRAAPSGSSPILSASNETSHGFGVGYETITKWTAKSSVIAMRVNGYTSAKGRGAINYGKTFLGRDFSFFTTRDSNDYWYCSKLVWRAWKSQGKDLEYNTWYYLRGVWVTPSDIYDDSDTYRVAGDTW